LNQALTRAEDYESAWDAAVITTLLGLVTHQQHEDLRAKAYFQEGLRRLRLFGSPVYIAWCLEGCAATLASLGSRLPALHLCAAAVRIRQKAGSPLPLPEQAAFDRVIAWLRGQFSPLRFQQEWEKGAGYTQDQAIEEALQDSGSS
jgi:hypothetical protein